MPVVGLELPPEPASVGAARRWLASELSDWSSAGVSTAVLVLSELVTNVVLHARTMFQVRLRREGKVARIEVSDEGTAWPVAKNYDAGAYTGRGLHLVEMLSLSWGVDAAPGSKSVWAEVADSGAQVPRPIETIPHAPSGQAVGPSDESRGAPQGRQDMVTVRIIGMPLTVYLEAQEHNDAVIREFALLAVSHESESVPSRLIALAAEVGRYFAPATEKLREQVEQAVARHDENVDLVMDVPRAAWSTLGRLSDLLDEADNYCEQGGLLTLASSPMTRHFRTWYTAQVRSQLQGSAPEPWPGP